MVLFCCCCGSKPPLVRDVKLVCVGIDGSGKTTILKLLKGEDPRGIMSTNGFSKIEMNFNERFHLTVFDLGGGERIRDIWDNYYAEAHGIIFVMNMACPERFEEAYACISKCISNRDTAGKPILFVLNNVTNGDVDDVEFVNKAQLHETCEKNRQQPFISHLHTMTEFLIANYAEISQGVRQAEVALKIRQQEAKEARRLRLMQMEHENRRKDIEGLENRTTPPHEIETLPALPSNGQLEKGETTPPVLPNRLTSPVPSPADTPASPLQTSSHLSSEVFEADEKAERQQLTDREPADTGQTFKINKVAPADEAAAQRASQLKDPTIFNAKYSRKYEAVEIRENTGLRNISRMQRIKDGISRLREIEQSMQLET